MSSPEANMALVQEHAVHEHRRDLAKLLDTLTHDPVYEDVPRGLRWEGRKQVEQFYLGLIGSFPDIKFDLVARRGGPDHVVEEVLARGTHLGPLDGHAPTGRKVSFRICIVFPFHGGKIAGEVVYYDRLGIYQQLGMLPAKL